MSSVNFLEKLLDGVSVEWKSLGDICSIKTGPNINKNIISNNPGIYPVINSGRDPLGYVNVFNTENDPIGIASRGSVGLVSWTPGKYFRGNLNYSCTVKEKNKLDVRYLYHYLLHADAEIQALATHQGIPALNASALKTLQVPLAPLEIQAEIVRILDAMTAHTAELTVELTVELTARKKQYNYYRDKLLSFEDGEVEWKKLIDACDYVDYRGKTPKKTEEGIFLVTAKNIRMGYIDYTASEEFVSPEDYSLIMRRGLPRKGDILITTEAPCGFVAQVDRENIALAQRVIKYRSKDKRLSNDFIKHYLISSHFQKKLMNAATGSTVKGIKGSTLHQLTIPIPSEEVQSRVVAILDKLDALTNSITEGLPREIELRQKQYAYYRDLLLSFPQVKSP